MDVGASSLEPSNDNESEVCFILNVWRETWRKPRFWTFRMKSYSFHRAGGPA